MEQSMFNQQAVENWLNLRSQEISIKLGREIISSEEMLTLILRDQVTNFRKIESSVTEVKHEIVLMKEEFGRLKTEIREEIRDDSEKLRNEINTRFEHLWGFLKWQGGALLALFGGIYLKLFFG